MCSNTLCPSRLKCLRFTAIPNKPRQVYHEFLLTPESDKCMSFIDGFKDALNTEKIIEESTDKDTSVIV